MKISIGTDHHGYNLAQDIIKILEKKNIEYYYSGAKNSDDTVELDTFIKDVTYDVKEDNILGILICGTGIGVNIGANKVSGIRASLCNNFNQVRWGREKDNMNILCISAREEEYLDIEHILNVYLNTNFENEKIMDVFNKMDTWR